MILDMDLPHFGKDPAGIAIFICRFDLVCLLNKTISGNETDAVMITDRLAKWLFPRWQPYRRKREVRTILAALWVGLIAAALIVGLLVLINSSAK